MYFIQNKPVAFKANALRSHVKNSYSTPSIGILFFNSHHLRRAEAEIAHSPGDPFSAVVKNISAWPSTVHLFCVLVIFLYSREQREHVNPQGDRNHSVLVRPSMTTVYPAGRLHSVTFTQASVLLKCSSSFFSYVSCAVSRLIVIFAVSRQVVRLASVVDIRLPYCRPVYTSTKWS